MVVAAPTLAEIDQWPVATAGLPRLIARRAARAGLVTIGDLRQRLAAGRPRIPRLGRFARQQTREFLSRLDQLAASPDRPGDVRTWFDALLPPLEQLAVEQRYGLTDPLFRPAMPRRTLREIGESLGGVTRERARQVLRQALDKLSSRHGQTLAAGLWATILDRFDAGVVTAAELGAWRGAPELAGYQPWGVLLLLAETGAPWRLYRDYFAVGPVPALEEGLLTALAAQPAAATLADLAPAQPARLARVILSRHPAVALVGPDQFRLVTRRG